MGLRFDYVRNDEALRSNTLIVVASDNGHENGAGMSEPFQGGKNWLYEADIRSPLIVWGPGLVAKEKAGKINADSVLCSLDLNRPLEGLRLRMVRLVMEKIYRPCCLAGLQLGGRLQSSGVVPRIDPEQRKRITQLWLYERRNGSC